MEIYKPFHILLVCPFPSYINKLGPQSFKHKNSTTRVIFRIVVGIASDKFSADVDLLHFFFILFFFFFYSSYELRENDFFFLFCSISDR